MHKHERNRRSTLPVSRNIVGPSTPNRDTCIPLTSLTVVTITGVGPRKGRARQKIGMWGNVSPYYRTAATHDPRWSRTISNGDAS